MNEWENEYMNELLNKYMNERRTNDIILPSVFQNKTIYRNQGGYVLLVGENNFYSQYEVALRAFNAKGMGPMSDIVRVRSAMGCKLHGIDVVDSVPRLFHGLRGKAIWTVEQFALIVFCRWAVSAAHSPSFVWRLFETLRIYFNSLLLKN